MTGDILKAGIIGWPVAHSRSPLIHTYWLEKQGLAGRYDRLPVRPGELAAGVAELAANGYRGANVTIPHKESAFELSDELDDAARAIGAVNTLVFADGRILGSNTDSYGFTANLQDQAPDWRRQVGSALVLGAGGAARAIIHALLNSGVERLILCNRTGSRADQLSTHFNDRRLEVLDWARRAQVLDSVQLLVNTTSLGMSKAPPLEIDLSSMPAGAIVSDLVYVPLETPLLRGARQNGLLAVDGLGMLLHQAVPGFRLWFGGEPLVTRELRARIIADLDKE
jgi:shikimate dehydrogenase